MTRAVAIPLTQNYPRLRMRTLMSRRPQLMEDRWTRSERNSWWRLSYTILMLTLLLMIYVLIQSLNGRR